MSCTFGKCSRAVLRARMRAHASQGMRPQRVVSTRAYQSTTDYDYDLFTIGGGSGGVRASRISSSFGAKVACAELPFGYMSGPDTGGLGGTCVLRGCVPKKLVLYASEYAEYFRDARGFGWDKVEPAIDWSKFMEKKRKELRRLNGVYNGLLENANVEIIEGRGKLVDAHTVEVNGKQYTSKYICVAVGGTPHMLGIEGIEHCISSDGILELDELPKRLGIVGAGYIGVEFGGMFSNFGTQVDFFMRGDKLLRGFDEEIRDCLTDEYQKRGIQINPGCSPKKIVKNDDGSLTMTYSSPDGDKSKTFDQILMATGRSPNTANLGLEAAGVETDKKGYITVDEYSKTSQDNIYAVGDITNRMALTPVALMEGMALAKTLFSDVDVKPNHRNIPTAVFSQPNIGTVGVTEEYAVEQWGDVDVYTSSFKPMRNTISGNESRGFMKIIVNVGDSNRVVGMHMLGPEAGEIMQGFGVAVKMEATKEDLDSTVGIHPSSAEEFVTMRSVTRRYRKGKLVE